MTYPAILRDGKIEWTAGGPPSLPPDAAVPVHVTVLAATVDVVASGEGVADAMEAFAAAGGPSGFDDPSEWQREQRIDRTMPGRDE